MRSRRRVLRAGALGASLLAASGWAAVACGAQTVATTPSAGSASPVTTTSVPEAVMVWARAYEHDIGILADDTLVVADDGKHSAHPTKQQVATTLRDCEQWGHDATRAAAAAPPIPEAAAQAAWSSMVQASGRAAHDCTAALQHGDVKAARDFGRQLQVVRSDEAALTVLLGSPGP